MLFNGSAKQAKWAQEILDKSNLDTQQIDNLLRWAGPTMYSKGIMDSIIVIDNRHNLARYADALGWFYNLTETQKHEVAEQAAGAVSALAKKHV